MQAEKKEPEAPKEPEQMDTDTAADAQTTGEGAHAPAETTTGAGGPQISEPMVD